MKIPKLFKKAAAFVMAAVTALSIMPATAFAVGDIGTISFPVRISAVIPQAEREITNTVCLWTARMRFIFSREYRMADIKTRDAVKGTIKTIDKAAIASERMKSAYVGIKERAEQGYYADKNSATEYAADRISFAADRVKDEGIHHFNKQGQKAVKTTTNLYVTFS